MANSYFKNEGCDSVNPTSADATSLVIWYGVGVDVCDSGIHQSPIDLSSKSAIKETAENNTKLNELVSGLSDIHEAGESTQIGSDAMAWIKPYMASSNFFTYEFAY
ncbi:hypothetical protein B566_EDAN017618 [Ephemera danica]|nr:hypothetical protein B566_EDAN017618 [Ephemera danica]